MRDVGRLTKIVELQKLTPKQAKDDPLPPGCHPANSRIGDKLEGEG